MAKLIVLEGADGSGKATQAEALHQKLKSQGYHVIVVSFPNYESKTSDMIKEYLKGSFGELDVVNPYFATLLYSIDRHEKMRTIKSLLKQDKTIVIADRYTTSNYVHQMVRIPGQRNKNKYVKWLEELEYKLLKLPRPDKVILLDVPLFVSVEVRANRTGKTGGLTGDMLENDVYYQQKVHDAYEDCLKRFPDWTRIKCAKDGKMRSVQDISDEVFNSIKDVLQPFAR